MAPKTKKKPSPEDLLVEVKGQSAAKTYEFEDYIQVIDELQRKEHSYSDIAEFLKDRVGISASRGQVYRALQLWRAKQEELANDATEFQPEGEQGDGDPASIALVFERDAGRKLLADLADEYRGDEVPDMVSIAGILREAVKIQQQAAADENAAETADEKQKPKTEGKNGPRK